MSPRVLVADDDPDNRFVAAETLRHRGYSVCEAGDGEAAVAEALLKPVLPRHLAQRVS